MTHPVIADTSGLISLVVTSDVNHNKALESTRIIQKLRLDLVVPGEVVTEMINALGKKVSHDLAFKTGVKVLNDKRFLVRETIESVRGMALDMFEAKSKSVSFTDCLVMAFAQNYSTKFIFGFDRHFSKSGYMRVGIETLN